MKVAIKDWPQKFFLWPIRSGQFKRFWNWFGKSKCPGARLDLTVNFHHGHFIDPTNCPWVSEDGSVYVPSSLTDAFKRPVLSPLLPAGAPQAQQSVIL